MRKYDITTCKEPKDINEDLIYRFISMKVIQKYKDIESLNMGLKRDVTEYKLDYDEIEKVLSPIYMEIDFIYKGKSRDMNFSYHNEIQVIRDIIEYFNNLK